MWSECVFFYFVWAFCLPLFYDCLASIKKLFPYYQIIGKLYHSSCCINDRYLVMLMPTHKNMPHWRAAVLLLLVKCYKPHSSTFWTRWVTITELTFLWKHHFNNYMSRQKHSQASKSLSPLCKRIKTSEKANQNQKRRIKTTPEVSSQTNMITGVTPLSSTNTCIYCRQDHILQLAC